MQTTEKKDLNKERCMERGTDVASNPLMQWLSPRAKGSEFTPEVCGP